jgi:hypothetical protein
MFLLNPNESGLTEEFCPSLSTYFSASPSLSLSHKVDNYIWYYKSEEMSPPISQFRWPSGLKLFEKW